MQPAMDNTTNIALSRLAAESRAVDITANNIANASTPGYQAERLVFADWLVAQRGTDAPRGGQNLIFTQDRATYRDQSQGSFSHTGNPLDLAIGGQGYFTVQTANGVRLTRAGRFAPDATGAITDSAGNTLLGSTGQPLKLGSTDRDISVAADGTISAKTAAGQNSQIGKIAIVAPADPYALTAEGNRLFRANGPTAPVSAPKLSQGAIEDSNVQPVSEITRLIAQERDFQMVTKFVEAEGERKQAAIAKLADIGAAGG